MTGEFTTTPDIEEGKVIGEFGIVRDITEHKKAEQALEESVKRFHDVAENALAWIWEVDTDGAYTYVSHGVRGIMGYEPEEMVGKYFFEFFHPDDREKLRSAAFDSFSKMESFREFVNRNLHKDGSTVWLSTSGVPIVDGKGNLVGYRGGDTDITERKEWEQELQMLNTELEGYAHMVSHDLKGPLSSIMAASVTLRRLVEADYTSIDLPGIREMTRMIETNVVKSDQLIENLLELAEAGQKPVEVSEVNITEIVDRVLGERASQVSERGVKVIKGDDLGRVVADSTHLYQLFGNLIDNAIKHNDSDEPALTVSYMGEESPGAHRYLVRDNGSGFDTGDMEIMFKPFYSGKRGEYGIGLATVRKIIDVYGGAINTYNDGGACFEFVIKDIR